MREQIVGLVRNGVDYKGLREQENRFLFSIFRMRLKRTF